MNRTFTEQGWNTFGGYSYYQGEGACAPGAPVYPVCNRARVVSFDRPYDTGDGRVGLPRRRVPARAVLRAARPRRRLRDRRDGRPSTPRSWRTTGCCSRSATTSRGRTRARRPATRAEAQGPQRRLLRRGLDPAARPARRRRRSGRTARRSTTATRARTRSTATASAMQVTGNTWSSPPDGLVRRRRSSARSTAATSSPGLSAPFVVADASSWVFRGHGPARRLVAARRHRARTSTTSIQYLGDARRTSRCSATRRSRCRSVYTNQGTWGDDTYSDMTYYTDPHDARPASSTPATTTGSTRWATCPRTGAVRGDASSRRSPATSCGCSARARRAELAPVAVEPRLDPAGSARESGAARRRCARRGARARGGTPRVTRCWTTAARPGRSRARARSRVATAPRS